MTAPRRPHTYLLPSGPLVRKLRELTGKEPLPMIGDPSPNDLPHDIELGLEPEPDHIMVYMLVEPDPTEDDEEAPRQVATVPADGIAAARQWEAAQEERP
jgi:hypothetical protein